MRASKDGDNQQQETLTAQTLRGAGRAGAVREMQTRRAPTANVENPQEAKQAEEFPHPDKEWSKLHQDMDSEDDTWAGMGKRSTVLGKSQKNDRSLIKKGPQKKTLRQG